MCPPARTATSVSSIDSGLPTTTPLISRRIGATSAATDCGAIGMAICGSITATGSRRCPTNSTAGVSYYDWLRTCTHRSRHRRLVAGRRRRLIVRHKAHPQAVVTRRRVDRDREIQVLDEQVARLPVATHEAAAARCDHRTPGAIGDLKARDNWLVGSASWLIDLKEEEERR